MASTYQIFDKLLVQPLFLGMSRAELELTIEKTVFEFHKFEAGQVVVGDGQRSGQLMLLVDGEAEMATRPADNSFTLVEDVRPPFALQPERMFGLTQRYTATVTARTPCSCISLSKAETLRLTSDSLIFRLNLLNLLSTALQKSSSLPWRKPPETLTQRLCHFFLSHSQRPAGHKRFLISMEHLATCLNDTRRNVSLALRRMQSDQLVGLSRGCVDIPAIEKLAQH